MCCSMVQLEWLNLDNPGEVQKLKLGLDFNIKIQKSPDLQCSDRTKAI